MGMPRFIEASFYELVFDKLRLVSAKRKVYFHLSVKKT